jgi:hypothetical protein
MRESECCICSVAVLQTIKIVFLIFFKTGMAIADVSFFINNYSVIVQPRRFSITITKQ